MLAALDSSQPPSLAQVQQAAAGNVKIWAGYLATRGNMGLLRPWSEAEFSVARQCGAPPIAYCSGWDDPALCKQQAAAWGVRLCLDVENGIRPDGPWVQPWLDASGAGLYGNGSVHVNRTAAFHVFAGYFGRDPGATWPPGIVKPPVPTGWQWEGSHLEFGVEVDRSWFDDWFAALPQEDDLTPQQDAMLKDISARVGEIDTIVKYMQQDRAQVAGAPGANLSGYAATVIDIYQDIRDIRRILDGASSPEVAALTTKIDAISKHLGVGTP